MLFKYLILFLSLLTISLSTPATSINLPVANPSIPNNVYDTTVYTTPKIDQAYNDSARRIVDTFINEVDDDQESIKLQSSVTEHDSNKQSTYEVVRRQFASNTVINMHNDKGGVSVTVPFSAGVKSNLGEFSNFKDAYMVSSPLVTIGITELKHSGALETTDTAFTYTGLKDTYIRKTYFSGAVTRELTNVKLKFNRQDSPEYNVVLFSNDTDILPQADIDAIIANYIVPSVQTMDNLDVVSHSESFKGYTFRIPHDAIRDEQSKAQIDGVTYKLGNDIYQQIRIEPHNGWRNNVVDIFDDMQHLVNVDKGLSQPFGIPGATKIVKVQSTYVWNDGIPGLLLDYELDNHMGILQFITYDDDYRYNNTLQYPVKNTTYTKQQLRYMMMDSQLKSMETQERQSIVLVVAP